MTIDEASTRYSIPVKILREYERWGFREDAGARDYDAHDIERLSTIITLYEIGFAPEEVEQYMRLLLADRSTENERMQLLNRKRNGILDEIHFKEKQLDRLDYLRYGIRQANGKKDLFSCEKGV